MKRLILKKYYCRLQKQLQGLRLLMLEL